ncbi:S6 family peptidase [Otariodibacter oris]|uniref:Immunoglobulin A1 protease autotransporter n=1 Tax=Otariodibacter oris TaxID=1032623 RepID=A0A420XFI3_9PAST|nr:S6 family peptidase [Otariodibacter oris]QGM81605.1 hypothetical protein A6A10_09445 [Otariodibacter oris]RKR71217.1 IgA-specific serine endopeptidase [Otariodibacter oris]
MSHKKFKIKLLVVVITTSLSNLSLSSIVRNDVNYQYFRDFAENKGKFYVGASNVPIYDLSDQPIGIMLKNIPMIDFSSTERLHGIATAINPQYVVSVAHNNPLGWYNSLQFGGQGFHPDTQDYDYRLVNRNNYPTPDPKNNLNWDYQLPRLNKLITEAVPSTQISDGLNNATYLDSERFVSFIRVGSGLQKVINRQNEREWKRDAYNYLTGGAPLKQGGRVRGWSYSGGNVFDSPYGPLITYGLPGDSGSPIWVYDKQENKWLLHSVLQAYRTETSMANNGALIRKDWNDAIIQNNFSEDINNDSTAPLIWKLTDIDGKSIITDNQDTIHSVDIYNPSLQEPQNARPIIPAIDHGKSVRFTGNEGKLTLVENINQGAGALYFNANFTVQGQDNTTTWLGAGISVTEGKIVNWKVKNPKNDRLSKIGKGTLHINGIGENLGNISIGDGTVILDQGADPQGKKQAFNQLGIVSGRPTVILNSADQIDPNQIYFGFRGGKLDINGNELTFNHIKNVDEGAIIVNHNSTQSATINIVGNDPISKQDLNIGDREYANKDLYIKNGHLYFLPTKDRSSRHPYFPNNKQSNEYWEYLGEDAEKAKEIAVERKNKQLLLSGFNGYFGERDPHLHNGKLNINFQPKSDDHLLLISGGTELNGNLSLDKGKVILSGRPTPHAYDHLHYKEVVIADDWINRSFNATNMIVSNNATLHISRNVSAVNSDFQANNNATLNLGFIQGTTPECIRTDHSGIINCNTNPLAENVLGSIPTTQIQGNIILSDNANLNLGKSILTGSVAGKSTTKTTLNRESKWILTQDSTVGELNLSSGSEIQLNDLASTASTEKYNTLSIDKLTGNGFFRYTTNLNKALGDKVIIHSKAEGEHKLFVQDSGLEPKTDELTLFTVNNFAQNALNLSVSLANPNKVVDLGTYRYQLKRKNDDYVLSIAHKNGISVSTEKPKAPPLVHTNGEGVTAEDNPEIYFKNGKGVTAEDKPEIYFKNGEGVIVKDKPEIYFKNGEGVTAEDKPEIYFKNGEVVNVEDKPEIYFKNGEGVTAEDKPEIYFKNGEGVIVKDKPEIYFKNGESVTAEDKPEIYFKNGEGVTAEDKPEIYFKNGEGMTAEDKPEIYFKNGEGVTAEDKPEIYFKNGEGVTVEDKPEIYFKNGEGVNAEDKPEIYFKNGEGVNAEDKPEIYFKNGEGVNAEDKPEIYFKNGEGVNAEDKPEIYFKNGESVTAEDKPEVYFKNGEGVTAEDKPEIYFKNGEGVNAEDKPEIYFKNGEGVNAEDKPEIYFKNGESVTAEDKPEVYFKNGEGVTAEDKPEADFKSLNLTTEDKIGTIDNNSTQAEMISRYANTALSELSSQMNTLLITNGTIEKEIIDNDTDNLRVWSNIQHAEMHNSSDYYREYQQSNLLTQVGVEKAVHHNVLVGGVLSHSHSSNTFDDNISGKGKLLQFNLYAKKIWENRFFSSLDMSYGKTHNRINTQDQIKFNRDIISVGWLLGKSWLFDDIEIKPSMGIRYYHLSDSNYELAGAKIAIKPVDVVTYQLGLGINKTFNFNKLTIIPEFQLNFVDTLDKNINLTVNNIRLNQKIGRYFENQLGVTAKYHQWGINVHASLLNGNEIRKQHVVGLKLSYNW